MAFSGLIPAVLLLSLSLSLFSHASKPCVEQEKASLLQFLAGLTRDSGLAVSWHKHNGTADCCSWDGVTCDTNGTVVEVSLAVRGLEGHISPALGDLTGLRRLNLSHNSLSGDLPLERLVSAGRVVVVDVSFNRLSGELGELPLPLPAASSSSATHGRPLPLPLQALNVSSNMFTGDFPSSSWNLTPNLVVLNASNNSFSGQVPSSFCLASPSSSIAVLDLQYNKFSGAIPPALGNCSMLRVLRIGHNNLSGTIPDELFKSTSLLERLGLRNAGLRGTLDGAHVAKLTAMVALDLGENNFTGKVPESIGQLRRLEELLLDYNQMSGELPPSLCNCTSLTNINIKNNNFGGELSSVNFATLQNLKRLDVAANNFTGTIPESIYSCTNLMALRVSGNNLHGELSPRILNLKSLTFLSLYYNNFTNITKAFQILKSSSSIRTLLVGKNFMREAMPQDQTMDGFGNLQALGIHHCSLTGKIPTWVSKLRNLEVLLLSHNRLEGQIPSWIKDLNRLSYLDLSNNSLSGKLPTELLHMTMLKSIKPAAHLDPGFFAMPIYISISHPYRQASAFPKVLDLSNNDFTGRIPGDIGQLEALNTLNLSFNRLDGEIPHSLCNLTNLQFLDLSSNLLTGEIPAALKKLHFLSMFNVSNNDLEGPVPTEGQLSTFPNSSFDGNPKLCGSMLTHRCNPNYPIEAAPTSIVITRDCSEKIIFAVAFAVSFGLGVLYDQLVLSTFSCCFQS
ncbi:receptor-like protein 2 [Sorghum bicolor]|uniref:Leucine-rich repeat-containing N-terminal plant-type domain-containing protein n=1 Tax=Sorghum bicolor TaxID=4558 RepID=C5XVB5_SORBI|nr:receptor-like protein 2 [Sorghum bicolor]XP_021315389.1 receptor-like protein 2 [Sorghum bicolor]XP_021315390.1 receptor-like protein 2 [Sorghum bicolor]XP_021315391.1 receptor-like protein 2 [Sorghum bicolor]EES06303.1 hypothetical protein SORBI_3004G045500 [Sorghum bicolor]|eukprot:XP_002453327.1 receptor-like protein 2 [Sorghum bicolor]